MISPKRIIFIICLLLFSIAWQSFVFADNLDTSFGTDGVAITDFGIGDDEAFALAVQPDGKILAAGASFNGAVNNMALARYLANGLPDESFGGSGYVTFSLANGDTIARAISVMEDGRIVLAGSSEDNGNSDMLVVRLTADGLLDNSFGTAGYMQIAEPAGDASAESMAVTTDGTIYIAGTLSIEGSGESMMIARIDNQGELDLEFGDAGVVVLDRQYDTNGTAMMLLADNSILVAGSSSPEGVPGVSLVQFNEDGSPAESFGDGGEVAAAVAGEETVINDVLVQSDGRIVAAGSINNGSYREALLLKFLEDGNLDESFGTGGIMTVDLGYDAVIHSLAGYDDGSLVMAGFGNTGDNLDMLYMRLDGEETEQQSETLPAATEDDGETPIELNMVSAEPAVNFVMTDIGSSDDQSQAIAILDDGRVVAAGSTTDGQNSDFAVVSYRTGESGTEALGKGITTGDYTVVTIPVSNATRNSAASGGVIRSSCSNCEQQVIQRGVVYGVVANPVYRSDSDTTTSDTTTTDTTSTDATDVTDSTDTTTTDTLTNTDTTAAAGIFSTNSETSNSTADNIFNYRLVRSGQTDDGTGTGAYGSSIVGITPDVRYYVRAYAILSDNTVIYGNQVSFETQDACFIATAAFGSILDSHVVTLRQFRDRILAQSQLGQKFIQAYYHFSPGLADVIRESETLRAATRLVLMPLIALSYLLLSDSLLTQMGAILLLSTLLLLPCLYSVRKRVRRHA